MDNFKNIQYFTPQEFDSPDVKGSGKNMDRSFLLALDNTRKNANFPFIVTSGYRTISHNLSVGGAQNSAHIRGKAADIYAPTLQQKDVIIRNAIKNGMTGIGVMKSAVHLDNDTAIHPKLTFWRYNTTDIDEYRSLLEKYKNFSPVIENTIELETEENTQKEGDKKLIYAAIVAAIFVATFMFS